MTVNVIEFLILLLWVFGKFILPPAFIVWVAWYFLRRRLIRRNHDRTLDLREVAHLD